MISKKIRNEIKEKIAHEITTARNYKRNKATNWHRNEDLYHGEKNDIRAARSNVNLGQMHGYIQTLASKIDNPLIFKADKFEVADTTRAIQFNALARQFAEQDKWAKKGRAGDFQALMYGRSIYQYWMNTKKGGEISSNLTPIDVHYFLIDPTSGGLDMEAAMYMGHYGVRLTESQLEDGKKAKLYYPDTLREITLKEGDAKVSPEEHDAENRYGENYLEKTKTQDGVYYFYSWCTTYKGERYYALYHHHTGEILRLDKLVEIQGFDMWPYWTWATFPDMTTFWTPSYADIGRELIEVQNVSVNQLIDNAQRINYPERIVRAGALRNPQRLQRYVPNGIITVNPNFSASDIQNVVTPSISTPQAVYELADKILQLNSGVTAGEKGLAEEDKVGIYEGNQAEAATRFGNLEKNRSDGWERFAELFDKNLKNNMTAKVAIYMIGTEGATYQKMKVKEAIPEHEYSYVIETTLAEDQLNVRDRRDKLAFLDTLQGNPTVNQEELVRVRADIAGLERSQSRRLFDLSGVSGSVVEAAEQDLQALLANKTPKRRMDYPAAYMKYLNQYLMEEGLELTSKQFESIQNHLAGVMPKFEQTLVSQIQTPVGQPGIADQMAGQPVNLTAPQGQPLQTNGVVPPQIQ